MGRSDPIRRAFLGGLISAAALGAAGLVRASDGPVTLPRVRLIDGTSFEPQRDGTALILVFWATYCPYCARHNAHIEKLYQRTRGLPLQILSAATDQDPPAVRAYMQRNGYTFPVTLDSAALKAPLTPRKVIPLTCCIDRQGMLRPVIPGEMLEEDVLDLARLAG